jgi:hypothetical protein
MQRVVFLWLDVFVLSTISLLALESEANDYDMLKLLHTNPVDEIEDNRKLSDVAPQHKYIVISLMEMR